MSDGWSTTPAASGSTWFPSSTCRYISAWIAAYPHLCATPDPPTTLRNQLGIAAIGLDPDSEATFEFLDALLDEIVTLFGSSHLHLGGDEVAATRMARP